MARDARSLSFVYDFVATICENFAGRMLFPNSRKYFSWGNDP